MHDLGTLQISSTHPCLVVYMLDQSGSMTEKFGGEGISKAQKVADCINEIIFETGLKCYDSNGDIKNRFEISVIGYGMNDNGVAPAWEGNLKDHWVVSIADVFPQAIGEENGVPIWISPKALGRTPMTRAFENAYKTFIKVKYEKADGILKTKIDEFDKRLKADKEARIRAYFTELCQANNIDFLPFERLGLKIGLSDSDKSLKDIVNTNIDNVVKSLEFIESLTDPDEYKAEILADYKQTLDVMRSINNAKYRKQQREAELQRLEAQKARAEQARLAAEARAKEVAPLQAPEEVPPPAIQEAPAPHQEVPAPVPQEEILHFTLGVSGTRAQLRALRQFLETNNINYNIQ